MDNAPHRHVRIRLARRRPAPGRVRMRVVEDGSGGQPDPQSAPAAGDRGVASNPLPETAPATTGTLPDSTARIALAVCRGWVRQYVNVNRVGAAVAIATLLFTGIATYFQAEVAQEQLNESRGEAAQQHRSQAAEVTYWSDTDLPTHVGASKVHVMNRSADPVAYVYLNFEIQLTDDDDRFLDVHTIASSIPPCTEVTYDPTHLQSPQNHQPFDAARGRPVIPVSLSFQDANGTDWNRSSHGLLQERSNSPGAWLAIPETASHVDVCGQAGS